MLESGLKVIKPVSCSTQLSMKFQMPINLEIAKINGIFMFESQNLTFILPINVKMPTKSILTFMSMIYFSLS